MNKTIAINEKQSGDQTMNFVRRSGGVLFAFALFVFGPGGAQSQPLAFLSASATSNQPKIVLELFTSQGCSSCPRADALFPYYIGRKDVIALSMSVDYWDYIGWRDTLAKPIFTARQRSYGSTIGDGIIYTPEIVVDGRAHFNGSDKRAINKMIERRKKALAGRPHVGLGVTTKGDMLHVSVGEKTPDMHIKKATLWMALFSKKKSVRITRGENQGRSLSYHNVVSELTPIGRWTGEKMLLKLPKKQIMQRGADGCVILLQNGDGGPIIAAAEMPSW
ncbi:MAG: DUF1223 domain-containing protein [Hyphomicrobiaceae bacterium]|nr:DUF1223 domain-containing protein [Hyphomicrobiaceae bacterium]